MPGEAADTQTSTSPSPNRHGAQSAPAPAPSEGSITSDDAKACQLFEIDRIALRSRNTAALKAT